MIGTVLDGKYRIESLIGMGGMANVYKATSLISHKIVAIKVLKDEFSKDAEFVRRFRSEAQTVLNLSHDNIVRSMDLGTSENDVNYIVLEYIEGKTLKEQIRMGGKMDNKTTINIAVQLCDALTHAHERNLIHRDVKPQNVLLNDKGRAKIADFGIARRVDASTMTFAGNNLVGSVHYISPEQARGENVDAKSDIYSLGIVLYEMATGTVPFDADNMVSIAIKHIQSEMEQPIFRNPQIGKALNAIIIKATQKNKAARYFSTKEMKRDLLRALREPGGDFVKISDTVEEVRHDAPRLSVALRNVLKLTLAVIVMLGLFLVLFFIGKTIIDNANSKNVRYVPMLIGKSEQEAADTAKRMDLKVLVRSRVVEEGVLEGVIFAQEPKAGNKLQSGDTVYIDVSAGSYKIDMPEVEGQRLDEVQQMFAEWGIEMELEYQLTDAEEGMIFKQQPESGIELQRGDVVTLWISGQPDEREPVPSLVGEYVDDAISLANGAGFKSVMVHEINTDDDTPEGKVVNQLPLASELMLPDSVIEIWSSRVVQHDFVGDFAFNIDVEMNDSNVMVTVKKGISEYVVFDEVLPAGPQTIPLTIEADDERGLVAIVYINGDEVRRDSIELKSRS